MEDGEHNRVGVVDTPEILSTEKDFLDDEAQFDRILDMRHA